MTIPFVDCQGLAGAWTLGTVQAGGQLVARKSLPGGFGDNAMDANRDLVGYDWEQEVGEEETWEAAHGVGYVCGTPPCSGFSLLNTSKQGNARGPDSKINNCMKDLLKFSSRCTGLDGGRGPEVVAFESVQGAYSQGRDLMLALRAGLEERTGQTYALTHVKMSGASVGSAQMRHRYYPVFHRIPFTVTTPEKKHVNTYEDAIGDLVGADTQSWGRQPYPTGVPISEYAAKLRRDDDVLTNNVTVTPRTLTRLIDELLPYWRPGEDLQKAALRFYEATGKKPENVREKAWLIGERTPDEVRKLGPLKGWSWPRRIAADKPGYVLTGAGLLDYVHWEEERLLTVREGARLMGYPDDWDWTFAKNPMNAGMLIGKCCPVQSGRWISEQVFSAIATQNEPGDPGDVKLIGDREYLHDSTNIYKPWLAEQRQAQEA